MQMLEPLLDITQIAEALEMPPDATRMWLDIREQRPAATYRGKPLWMRDAVHALIHGAE